MGRGPPREVTPEPQLREHAGTQRLLTRTVDTEVGRRRSEPLDPSRPRDALAAFEDDQPPRGDCPGPFAFEETRSLHQKLKNSPKLILWALRPFSSRATISSPVSMEPVWRVSLWPQLYSKPMLRFGSQSYITLASAYW